MSQQSSTSREFSVHHAGFNSPFLDIWRSIQGLLNYPGFMDNFRPLHTAIFSISLRLCKTLTVSLPKPDCETSRVAESRVMHTNGQTYTIVDRKSVV